MGPLSRRSALQLGGVAIVSSLTGCSALERSTGPPHQTWKQTLGTYSDLDGFISAGADRLYAYFNENEVPRYEAHLLGINATDGTTEWTRTTRWPYTLVADTEGSYTSSDDDPDVRVDAFAPDGQRLWTTPVPIGTKLALDAERVYAGNQGSSGLVALNRETGDIDWQAADAGEGAPMGVVDGTLYTAESGLTARKPSDGTVQWQISPDVRYDPVVTGSKEPVVVDSTIYAPTFSEVYALDTADGSSMWHAPFQPGVIVDVVGLNDESLYVAVSASTAPRFTNIYRVAADDGSLQAVFQLDEKRTTGLALTDSALAVVTRDSDLLVLDPVDLSERWRATVAEDDFVWMATSGNTVYTLNTNAPLRAFQL